VLKDLIALRPVFYWTDERVRAHVAVCVLGAVIEALMKVDLKSYSPTSSSSATGSCTPTRRRVPNDPSPACYLPHLQPTIPGPIRFLALSGRRQAHCTRSAAEVDLPQDFP